MSTTNSHRHSSPPEDREGPTRKRVGKACDRCRLKKSKCNGLGPCSRCQADNAICVFGERRRVQDRVYPKGYVEMLEQQQAQLVAAIRQLYSRLQPNSELTGWPGDPLPLEPNGAPLTHSILERLDLLYLRIEGGPIPDGSFEEDPEQLRQKMLTSQGLPNSPFDTDSTQPSEGNINNNSSSSPSHSSECRISPIFSSFSSEDKALLAKSAIQKAKPGRPRLNKTKSPLSPTGRIDGVGQRRRRSTKDAKQMRQEQQTLSTGFQLAMEQMPQMGPPNNPYMPFTQPNFSNNSGSNMPPPHSTSSSSTSLPVLVPIGSSFGTTIADISPPVSPAHIESFTSPGQLDVKPVMLKSGGNQGSISTTVAATVAATAPSRHSNQFSGTVTSPPGLSLSRPVFGHGHGSSVSSISSIGSIDASLSDGMFDLGDASLDDTVSLFDPFATTASAAVAAAAAAGGPAGGPAGSGAGEDDDPFSALTGFVTTPEPLGGCGGLLSPSPAGAPVQQQLMSGLTS